MYLAFDRIGGKLRFSLRISEPAGEGIYGYRQLFDLGPDPSRLVEQLDENCFFFSEKLEAAVRPYDQGDSSALLERLLYPFLHPDHRRQIDRFSRRTSYTITPVTEKQRKAIASEVHRFDLKRQYFLRYGAVDQSHLHKLHEKLARKLLGMSRDEREFYFMEQERDLTLRQIKTYVYAIFNLQSHFRQSFASFFPGALPLDEVEDAFTSALCRLNGDPSFYLGEEKPGWLHRHLRRYVIMFFDYSFEARSFSRDYLRSFRASHRTFKWPEKETKVNEAAVNDLFGETLETLKTMKQRDLSRLYRKKAMRLHPDVGGDHEKFILLTETYQFLMKRGE